MTDADRQSLADAYKYAWAIVKQDYCNITVEPRGWFKVFKNGITYKAKASELLEGLAILNKRIYEKEIKK